MNCTANQCGGYCKAPYCAKNCNGYACGRGCWGEGCASGCVGEYCGSWCHGENCLNNASRTDWTDMSSDCSEVNNNTHDWMQREKVCLNLTTPAGSHDINDRKCTYDKDFWGWARCIAKSDATTTLAPGPAPAPAPSPPPSPAPSPYPAPPPAPAPAPGPAPSPAPPPAPPPAPTTTTTSTVAVKKKSSGLKSGEIAGIISGSVLLVLALYTGITYRQYNQGVQRPQSGAGASTAYMKLQI